MKVYLVRASNDFHSNSFPHPLGLMYVSAYLKSRGDHEVQLRDQHIDRCPVDEIVDDVAAFGPAVVGIGAMTAEAQVLYTIAERVKARFPDVTVVSGGSHASAFTLESLADCAAIDYVVKGEGEETFAALVAGIERGERPDGVPGSAYRDEVGKPTLAPARTYAEDLDAMPWPDWDAIDFERYHGRAGMDLMCGRREQMSIFTSRACPYECIYCHNTFGKVFRARSAESVLAEMRTLYHERSIREFLVLDDIFNLDPVRAKAIARGIIAEEMDISLVFSTGFKADLCDEELIDLLCRAGLARVAYAVETATPRLQGMIKKGLDLDRVAQVIRWTAKRGVLTRGYFMVGFPTETEAEVRETMDWAVRSDLHIASFMRVQPFQGTGMRALAEEMGMEVNVPYEQYNYDYSDTNLSPIPDAKLSEIQRLAYRRFFGSPRRLARLVRVMPQKHRLPYFFWLWLVKLLAPKRFNRRIVQGRRARETTTALAPAPTRAAVTTG